MTRCLACSSRKASRTLNRSDRDAGAVLTLSHRENSSRVQDIVRIERSFERTHRFDFLACPYSSLDTAA